MASGSPEQQTVTFFYNYHNRWGCDFIPLKIIWANLSIWPFFQQICICL